MVEEIKSFQEEKIEEEEENTDSTEDTIIKRATEERKKIEAANAKKVELLEREEKLIARKEALRQLGGGSQAGQNIQISPEDKLKQESMKFFKGTEIEKAIEKHG